MWKAFFKHAPGNCQKIASARRNLDEFMDAALGDRKFITWADAEQIAASGNFE